ncbi:MAG TPA: hypothetical protein VH643_33065 [Gemmataceae bacterium]|jgi:hypothetical protein
MFRSLIHALFASRPQANTRPQAQHFRPRLEALEGRLTPSPVVNPIQIPGNPYTQFADQDGIRPIFQLQYHNFTPYNFQFAFQHDTSDIDQVQVYSGLFNSQFAVGNGSSTINQTQVGAGIGNSQTAIIG